MLGPAVVPRKLIPESVNSIPGSSPPPEELGIVGVAVPRLLPVVGVVVTTGGVVEGHGVGDVGTPNDCWLSV